MVLFVDGASVMCTHDRNKLKGITLTTFNW